MSPTQATSGLPGAKRRPIRSGSGGACSAGMVVRTLAGLCTPAIPWRRIRRSIRLWFTFQPLRASSSVMRGSP